MATFNKFNTFVADVANGLHNLGEDTLGVMLTKMRPSPMFAVDGDIDEIPVGNGYPAGGAEAALISSAQSAGTYTLKLCNATFIATGGPIGPFRYCVLYNATTERGHLIGWYDYGTDLTITAGNSFAVQFDADNGVLQLA